MHHKRMEESWCLVEWIPSTSRAHISTLLSHAKATGRCEFHDFWWQIYMSHYSKIAVFWILFPLSTSKFNKRIHVPDTDKQSWSYMFFSCGSLIWVMCWLVEKAQVKDSTSPHSNLQAFFHTSIYIWIKLSAGNFAKLLRFRCAVRTRTPFLSAWRAYCWWVV